MILSPPSSNDQSTALPVPGVASSRFARLAAVGPVGLAAADCLHLHKPWVGCTCCRDACPAGCISLGEEALSLDGAACLHCGRCAAACPTQALQVEGFVIDFPDESIITISCQRQTVTKGALIRVPCLGGLHVNDLLAALSARSDRWLRLSDDSLCNTCASGSRDNTPAQRLCAETAPILRACAMQPERVGIATASGGVALPDGNHRTALVEREKKDAHVASRRAFFSGLARALSEGVVRRTAGASALLDCARVDKRPRRPIAHARALEARSSMRALAIRSAGAEPGEVVLPAVAASDACRLHGGCARLCPTGALVLSEHDGLLRLRFDPWQCIDCGICESACPESALRIQASTRYPHGTAAILLVERTFVACTRCGETTTEPSVDGLCTHCAKSAALAQAGYSLFGRVASRPNETGPP